MSEPCDLDQVTREIVDRGHRLRRPLVVGVDGPGASGKSTLASLLAARLDRARIVHVDDFYLPSAERPADQAAIAANFDLARLYRQVLRPAVAGHPVRYQRYDWPRDELADWVEIDAGVPLLVEGVYSTRARFRDLYVFRIVCQAAPEVRLRRGLDRDGAAMEPVWVGEWMPAEDRYLQAERPHDHADLVLGSDTDEGHTEPCFRVLTDTP